MARPWSSEAPPLAASVVETVAFPADEEDVGVVRVAWRGPDWRDQAAIVACEVLWEYLTDSPIAPLQRDFVEVPEPLCNDVGYSVVENTSTLFVVTLDNTPVGNLPLAQGQCGRCGFF